MSDGSVKQELNRFSRWLLVVYFTFIGGFAGWCGPELMTWRNVIVVVFAPIALTLVSLVYSWLPNRNLSLLLLLTPPHLFIGVVSAGGSLLMAWGLAEAVGRLNEPLPRVVISSVGTFLGVVLCLCCYKRRNP